MHLQHHDVLSVPYSAMNLLRAATHLLAYSSQCVHEAASRTLSVLGEVLTPISHP